ncbi:hypothetical protein GCU69_13170 [Streptomyces lycii]|uniref:Uncharacterized protein n=1 Tax=Streptomyces lycii TaxID=2654337 RepID=A0ABQ7FJV4_9ACTN|nr:hypothetical protein GCU69_13170 [Streptomyces lycii]
MNARTRWAVIWAGWVAYFCIAETIAVRSRQPYAPLCAYLRPALGAGGSRVHRAAGTVVVGTAVAWFIPHVFKGGANA